jgi:hypothetical protein
MTPKHAGTTKDYALRLNYAFVGFVSQTLSTAFTFF